ELRRNASPIAEVRVDQQCQELAHLFGFERHPELFQSRQIARPGLMGIVRPAILLPPDTGNRFSTDDLRMILAHEMAHQKRLDLLWMKLLLACEVLFFVHPLLWLARREWLLAQEIACDEIALR